MSVLCEIITIGDEILQGRTLNSNAAFLGKALTGTGVKIRWSSVVSDESSEIISALELALSRARIIITTGGLGPTPDDLTRDAICRVFDLELVENPEQRTHVEDIFERFGRPVPVESENQFQIPDGAIRIHNPGGTAAGIHIERDGRLLLAFPGVPQELEEMTRDYLLPFIRREYRNLQSHSKTLRLAGIGESVFLRELGDRAPLEAITEIAYLPNHGFLDIRLTARADDPLEAEAQIAEVESCIRERVGKYVYGSGDVRLEQVIGDILLNRNQRLVSAESCTGGMIANCFTDIPGASRWFERGYVTYSNRAKTDILDVPVKIIEAHGAVSEEVARAMAEGAIRGTGAHWSVASTGIAGPDGGTIEKPVGTVWIAVASEKQTTAKLLKLGAGDRERIKLRATHSAQFELYRALIDTVP